MKNRKIISVIVIFCTILALFSSGQQIYANTNTIKKAPIGKGNNNESINTIEKKTQDDNQNRISIHFQFKSFNDIVKPFKSDTKSIQPIHFQLKHFNIITDNNSITKTASTKPFIIINKFKSFADIVQEPVKKTTPIIEAPTFQHLTLKFVSFVTKKVIKSDNADRLIIAINNTSYTEKNSENLDNSTSQSEKNDQEVENNQESDQATIEDSDNTPNSAKDEDLTMHEDSANQEETQHNENDSTNSTDKDTDYTSSTKDKNTTEDTNKETEESENNDENPQSGNNESESTPENKKEDIEQTTESSSHSDTNDTVSSKTTGEINPIRSKSSVKKIYKKVLVISYEPKIDNKDIIDYYGWNNPRSLTTQIISNIKEASHGIVNYTVANYIIIKDFPVKNDGFKYTAESYKRCVTNNNTCHQPDLVDYKKILTQFDICKKVNNKEIDEVWLFGGPYFGYRESAIAGSKGLRYNNMLIYTTKCKKSIVVMGFNYERHLTEAIHSYSHRIESTMKELYGEWNFSSYDNNWKKFSLVSYLSLNDSDTTHSYLFSGCGIVHYTPNSKKETQYNKLYSNKMAVLSYCDYWFGNDTGPRYINCDKWGCTQLGYLDWWMQHIPYGNKDYGDSINDNWWYYIADPNKALQD